jgi:ferredoxin
MVSAEWRVRVDRGRCLGSGMCAGTAPGRFELDDTQHSRPTSEVVPEDDDVHDAATCCPAQAITLTDTTTGRVVYPADE